MEIEIFEAARAFLEADNTRVKTSSAHEESVRLCHEAKKDLNRLMNEFAPQQTIAMRFPELSSLLICEWSDECGFVGFTRAMFFDGDGCDE